MPAEQLPLEELNVQDDLTYSEYPVKILEISQRVSWSHHLEDEATWEREDELIAEFP